MKIRWALVGVDLDLEEHKAKRKAMEKRADARRQGLVAAMEKGVEYEEINLDDMSMADLGIAIETEGE